MKKRRLLELKEVGSFDDGGTRIAKSNKEGRDIGTAQCVEEQGKEKSV